MGASEMQKTSSLMVRLDEESKSLLASAAELRQVSVSDYWRPHYWTVTTRVKPSHSLRSYSTALMETRNAFISDSTLPNYPGTRCVFTCRSSCSKRWQKEQFKNNCRFSKNPHPAMTPGGLGRTTSKPRLPSPKSTTRKRCVDGPVQRKKPA